MPIWKHWPAFSREDFAGRDDKYWRTGLNRLAARPLPPAGCPRYGYLLETEAGPVGAVLLLCSESLESGEARIRCNASSWYTEPAYRMHAPMLIAAALKRRDVTYTNVSPAPHTWQHRGGTRVSGLCVGAGGRLPDVGPDA